MPTSFCVAMSRAAAILSVVLVFCLLSALSFYQAVVNEHPSTLVAFNTLASLINLACAAAVIPCWATHLGVAEAHHGVYKGVECEMPEPEPSAPAFDSVYPGVV